MVKYIAKSVFLVLCAFCLISANADSKAQVEGIWNGMFLEMEVKIKGEEIIGKIVKLIPNDRGGSDKCEKGSCKGKSLMGLDVFKDYKYNKRRNRWEGKFLAAGWNGKWYTTYVWASDDGLILYTKTYVGIFSRTAEWSRVKQEN